MLAPQRDGALYASENGFTAIYERARRARELNTSGSQGRYAVRGHSEIYRPRRRARARAESVSPQDDGALCTSESEDGSAAKSASARDAHARRRVWARWDGALCAVPAKTVQLRNLPASAKRARAESYAATGKAHCPCRQARRSEVRRARCKIQPARLAASGAFAIVANRVASLRRVRAVV